MEKRKIRLLELKHKKRIIMSLYAGILIIISSGLLLSINGLINHTQKGTVNMSIPELIIGVFIISVGIKCYIQALRFKSDLFKNQYIFNKSSKKRSFRWR